MAIRLIGGLNKVKLFSELLMEKSRDFMRAPSKTLYAKLPARFGTDVARVE